MKIKGFSDFLESEEIGFDLYVPIDIKWGSWDEMKASSIYYRFGNLKCSLLEISINSVSGLLRSLTLVLFKENVHVYSHDLEIDEESDEGKIPVFFTDGINQNIQIDATKYLEVELYNDGISINLSNDSLNRVYRTGRTYICVNDLDEIVSVKVTSLNDREMKMLRNTF